MTRPESEVIVSASSAGTQGWYSYEPLSKRRMGKPGPDGANPLEGSPYYAAIKRRTGGDHVDHRSFLEWDAKADSWMLLVLDAKRNIVGQTFGRTIEACERKMNDIYTAKGLGNYNGKYAE
jgi:hypothetical protein